MHVVGIRIVYHIVLVMSDDDSKSIWLVVRRGAGEFQGSTCQSQSVSLRDSDNKGSKNKCLGVLGVLTFSDHTT